MTLLVIGVLASHGDGILLCRYAWYKKNAVNFVLALLLQDFSKRHRHFP